MRTFLAIVQGTDHDAEIFNVEFDCYNDPNEIKIALRNAILVMARRDLDEPEWSCCVSEIVTLGDKYRAKITGDDWIAYATIGAI